MTMVEILTMVTVMGIVLFLTLPRLSSSKTTADEATAKAKATQLIIAKDAFIATRGLSVCQSLWVAATTDTARYTLIKPYLPQASLQPSIVNSTSTTTGFVPLGYLIAFNATLVTAPVKLYTDVNLNYALDSGEPEIPYY